jgi:hypothetical protein|nr:MAG TPA: hypothetical protein [Caudoviricetes sp.]
MRLIDTDKISNRDIRLALGFKNLSTLPDIRQLLDDQPTVEPQCIAIVKVDFSKEDVEKLVKQYAKESIEINFTNSIDRLKELLMEYSDAKNKTFLYGGSKAINGKLLDEETIDDIIRFIRERENNYV